MRIDPRPTQPALRRASSDRHRSPARRARSRGWAGRRTPTGRWSDRCQVGGSRRGGGTGRLRDSAGTRTLSCRATRRSLTHACWGSQSTRCAPVVGIERRQDALLGTAFAESARHQRTVGRRLEPVDRDGCIGGTLGRVEQRLRRRVGCRRPTARPARTDRRPRRARARTTARRAPTARATVGSAVSAERRSCQGPQVGPGIERLRGSLVVGGNPSRYLVRSHRLRATDRDRRRRRRAARRHRRRDVLKVRAVSKLPENDWLSHVPCWDACRGWPWSGACAPFSSSSSSTWGARLAVWPFGSSQVSYQA